MPEPRFVSASPWGENQIASWRTQGYALVNGLIPENLVEELAEAAAKRYPAPGTEEAATIADFGSGGALTFPSQVKSLNELTLNENLLEAIAVLLNRTIEDLRLTQSDLST